RQLLAELRKMRDALQALPRENAPTELSESFSGQLERSVLLDGIGDQPIEPRMRIVRWPQLVAVAAILLLAGGLGTVVYFELFSTKSPQFLQSTHTPVAPNPAEISANSSRANQTVETSAPPAGSADEAHVGPSAPPAAVALGVADHPNIAGIDHDLKESAALEDGQTNRQLAAIAHSALASNQVQALLGRSAQQNQAANASRPVVVMVVSTADQSAVARKLGTYLETNNADWQSAQSADGMKQADSKVLSGQGSSAFGAAGSKDALPSRAVARSGGDKETGLPATEPQTQPGALAYAYQQSLAPQAVNRAVAERQYQQQAASNQLSNNPVANALDDVQEQIGGNTGRCYVVRNLSFQQATQLRDILRGTAPDAQAPMFADLAVETALKADDVHADFHPQNATASAKALAAPTTAPATQPQIEPPTTALNGRSIEPNVSDRLADQASKIPQTMPAAGAAPATGDNIVSINNQTLLGSSPVDLVIVIKTAAPTAPIAAPIAAPTTNPATEPTTLPATQP
ncbi:MAG TPA: hypothetical protein VHY37_05165, partial [Tepidisphaeraceae bacterium]|nr:hypothetical protein [Tepidisphaeraceae bacterium]